MSNDDNGDNWRDRVKTPSKINEKSIGGKSSLPEKDGEAVDWKKLTEEELEEKKYDKEAHTKKLDEAFAEKESRAIKDYENRVTKVNTPEPPKAEKKLIEKIDDLVDKAGQGLNKAAPYLDDAIKIGSKALGVVSAFIPESTATDEEMRLHALNADEQAPPTLDEIENVEQLSEVEQERILDVFSGFDDRDTPEYLKGMELDIEPDDYNNDLYLDDIGDVDGDGGDGGE